MRETENIEEIDKIRNTLDTLIQKDNSEVLAHILTGGDGLLNTRIRRPDQKFILAIIEPDDSINGLIKNRYSTFALDVLEKKKQENYKIFGYSRIEEFRQDQPRRIEQGILFSAVCLSPNLLDSRVIREIQEMNSIVGEHTQQYSTVKIFTIPDLQNAYEELIEAQSKRTPLSMVLTSHKLYSIMGAVGTEFFSNITIGNDSVFESKYISKELINNYLNEKKFKKLISDVVIFNLVCSRESLDNPMKLGLLERLVQVNPSAYYIAMVNSKQYDQMIDEQGEHRQKYLSLRGMVDRPELFRLYRLTGEKDSLSTDEKGDYKKYFNALWQEYGAELGSLWSTSSKMRPAPAVSSHAITPIKKAKKQDIEDLVEQLGTCGVAISVCMREHTTIKIGGTAQAVVQPKSVEDIQKIVEFCKDRDISYWVLGNGSNLVLAEDIPGLVITTSGMHDYMINDDNATITAKCGAQMFGNYGIVKEACRHGLSGLEYAVNIPARAGGLVATNASYRMVTGEEMSTADVVKFVRVLDPDGNRVELKPDELGFSYKDSRFQKDFWDWIIYEVMFQLTKKSKKEIRNRMSQIIDDRFRRKSQPNYFKYPSAGSAYKLRDSSYISGGANYSAAELIVGAGCLEFNKRDSPLKLHERCPNFIINSRVGESTLSHVMELTTYVNNRVWSKYDIHLIPEIKVMPRQSIIS